jgi:hypothetical protein
LTNEVGYKKGRKLERGKNERLRKKRGNIMLITPLSKYD